MVNSRTKGANFERKIAKLLSDWSSMDLKRTPLSGGFSKSGSNYKGDINSTEGSFLFHIECKKYKGWTLEGLFSSKSIIWKWWNQAINDCPTTKIPTLIFSKNNSKDFVMIRHSDVCKAFDCEITLEHFRFNHFYIFQLEDFLEYFIYPRT